MILFFGYIPVSTVLFLYNTALRFISKHDYIQTIVQATTARGPKGCSTTKLFTSSELTNEFSSDN